MAAFVSYAQNFEDVMLWRALRHVESGFYIDVGAGHPEELSVTKAFYDRGWRGVSVEPDPDYAAQLRQARTREILVEAALGAEPGRMAINRFAGTGLTTFDDGIAARHTAAGYEAQSLDVDVTTLAAICREHAPRDIHFLKIDVEGAERAVLEGADFAKHRPWIVVIEATEPLSMVPSHQHWEPILLAARYSFVWFDGLNRYYVAEEQQAALGPAFQAPPNVFDEFVQAKEIALEVRRTEAELRAARADERALEAERRRGSAEAAQLMLRSAIAGVHASTSWRLTAPLRFAIALLKGQIGSALAEAGLSPAQAERLRRLAAADSGGLKRAFRVLFYLAARLLERLPGSARVSAGLERLVPSLWRRLRRRDAAYVALAAQPWTTASAALASGAAPFRRSGSPGPMPGGGILKIHQFHSGSALGDAVTNSLFLIQTQLRALGYESDIFVELRPPELADRLLEIDDLPRHADYVLIVHHSMGYDACEQILALPARKILMYHNITPPELLADTPATKRYAELGLRQLELLRPQMMAALAMSEFNTLELRAHGYDTPIACPLLFDVETLVARAGVRANRPDDAPFTILFVGRVVASKGQAELVDAFAEFRRAWGKPCRLVLVGRAAAPDAPYPQEISRRIAQHGLQDQVLVTGAVSDDELHAWYRAADVYVSLSKHEGFGVPLVEAMAHDLPVIAWPCGAVPYTLDGASVLLADRAPATVAAAILDLARAPERRAEIVARQRAVLDSFRFERQLPRLVQSLTAAGAAPPPRDVARRSMSENLRVAITGHVNGTYSLATMNRMMALTLEAHAPGTVRVMPWENGPVGDLSGVPPEHAGGMAVLASRPVPPTRPEIVISQHYPVLVPEQRGDATFAVFAWEESLIPQATIETLEAGFDGVFAMAESVEKALIDSGLSIAVRTISQPPDLDDFYRLGQELRAAPRKDDGVFTFLHVSSCFPRKGVDVLLAAYAQAFRRTDRVRLVIKGFPNPHNDVPEQIEKLRARDPDIADISMVNEDLGIDGMLDLYRAADAIVLPTRGEGFNLPAAEAMAAGIPLIVTGYGGHMDFCTPAEARFVDFRFQQSGSHVAVSGSVWVEPDQADLVAALREAFEDGPGSGASAERARRAETAVRERLAPGSWARRLREAALDALAAPALPPLQVAWISTWDVKCGVAEYSRFLVDHLGRPDGGRTASLLVLSDGRTPPSIGTKGPRVHPSWALTDATSIDGLARSVAAEDPDAVVIQHQPGLIAWPDLAQLLLDRRVRHRITVVTLHAALHLFDLPEAERNGVVEALEQATRILVHRVADLDLLKSLGLTRNVTLFPHGVPPRAAAPAARALTTSEAPVIGCYGFFLPGKGIPRLIESIAQLRRVWPNLRLRLVNAEFPAPASAEEIARCRRLAASLGLADAIDWDTAFHPHETSMERLSGCDLLVLPYDESKESASGAVRIALASGVPVAVTPTAIFDDAGSAVHRFPRIDVASIVADVDLLLRDQAARARLQQTAASWVAERSWDVLARRLDGMLNGLRASRSVVQSSAAASRTDEPQSNH